MNITQENINLAFSLGAIATVIFILVIYFMFEGKGKMKK